MQRDQPWAGAGDGVGNHLLDHVAGLPPAAFIAVAHRAQADSLEIEATAKRRLADEYDAAQERGEVATG